MIAISIHPFQRGPHRIEYLQLLYDFILRYEDVVMWTGAEILGWCRSHVRHRLLEQARATSRADTP